MGARAREPALVGRRLDPGSRQHTHTRNGFVWPLAIAMEGLTATDDEEREDALRRLEATVVGN